MSALKTRSITLEYRGLIDMIPWYRQVLALVFGMGVMLIALWAIKQGSGRFLIGGVAGMAFVTILLIFGVEVDRIEVGALGLEITFSSTTMTRSEIRRSDNSRREGDD